MHMADALVSPLVAGTMYVCSAAAGAYSLRRIKKENDNKLLPVMGVMGAFIFAAQMVNFSIPGTGASGHLTGGMLLSAILGPYAGFITMIGILVIQCLLFADGGLLALGCNVWNMAFYGCFIGALVIWKLFMRNGITKRKITIASVLGCIITLQFGAFSVTMETLASGITELPFTLFVSVMQPIHLAIGLAEGLITSAVLCFIYEARPELVQSGREQKDAETLNLPKRSYKPVIAALFAAFVIIAGGVSIFASSNPDGLEWAVSKITGTGHVSASGYIHSLSEKIMSITALFPDYSVGNSQSAAGTSLSGILGGIVTIAVLSLAGFVIRLIKNK